jgi:hypothetical protein
LFIDFISISEKSAFEKAKSEYSKQRKPESIAETLSLNGKVIVEVTGEKTSLGDCLDPFSKIAQELYDRIMKANKATVELMEKLSDAFQEEANGYKELASLYLSINVL